MFRPFKQISHLKKKRLFQTSEIMAMQVENWFTAFNHWTAFPPLSILANPDSIATQYQQNEVIVEAEIEYNNKINSEDEFSYYPIKIYQPITNRLAALINNEFQVNGQTRTYILTTMSDLT